LKVFFLRPGTPLAFITNIRELHAQAALKKNPNVNFLRINVYAAWSDLLGF
jgi:hypothetical protein